MLERSAMGEIESWYEAKTRQALLITGARQVGKTTLVREFAAQKRLDLVEVNFYEIPSAAETVRQARDTEDLIFRISVLTGKEMVAGKTILFLDEIQECSDILTWVKFLEEHTRIDIILSGSLIGVGERTRVRSLPVGFLQKMQMYPLRFEEFCQASGVLPCAWDSMEAALRGLRPVPDVVHSQLMDLFRKYLLIGGMPDAVQSFVSAGQLAGARSVQRAIFDLYEDDMAKYVESAMESRQIKMVYEAIPAQLCTPTKRFKYARLGKNLRFANMETAFDWLACSGTAIVSTRVGQVEFPLGLSEDRQSFKLFMSDVGILTSRLMGNVDMDVINGRDGINFGSIYENAVAQELWAAGFSPHHFSNKALGEIDFLVEEQSTGKVHLIEVKSGKGYKRHSALNNVLERGEAEHAIVLCNGNVECVGKRLYLPVYAASLFKGGRLID